MAGLRVAVPGRRVHPWYRWAVLLYDRAYRAVHGLDRPPAQVGPALCVEVRRSRRARRLPDGRLPARPHGLAPPGGSAPGLARHARSGAAALDDPRGAAFALHLTGHARPGYRLRPHPPLRGDRAGDGRGDAAHGVLADSELEP